MRYVYDFAEGSKDQKDLLGGKGAGLAEMTNLGLRVPPGFTITTEACRVFMERGKGPDGIWDEIAGAIGRLEESTGRSFGGGGKTPLLVSVRSGAKFSMPGMMDTILNLGINDLVVKEIAEWAGSERVHGTSTAASSRCSARWCSVSPARVSRRSSPSCVRPEESKPTPN